MRTVYLDLNEMRTPDDFHVHIANLLKFPGFYAKNLNALFDCLTDIGEDTEIVFPQAAVKPEYLGDYAKKLLAILEDAAEENDVLHISWR